MPDTTQSTALREQRTQFNGLRFEIQTLELRQESLNADADIDLVFVVDTSSSHVGRFEHLAGAIPGISADLGASVKYGVVEYKQTGTATFLTGADLVNASACQTALGTLAVSGGPDDGFSALFKTAKEINWREDSIRVAVIVTDVESDSRGKTYDRVLNSLLRNEVILFFHDTFFNRPVQGELYLLYKKIVEATGGSFTESTGTSANTRTKITQELLKLKGPVGDPIYLVNDTQNFIGTLETGQTKTFLSRSFALNPFNSGEDGALTISLTIDNTDFAVSKYLARIKQNAIALEVTYRVYLSDDNTQPQNNPPVKLYATDFETKGTTVSCQVRFLDLQNSVFPNAYYTPQRCPSLQ